MESDRKLFYRIDRKTGRTIPNVLEWERSWKNVKILKYPTRFANELRLGVRDNPHGGAGSASQRDATRGGYL